MTDFEVLLKEVELLQEDVRNYLKGLTPYSDINDRLSNISVLVDYMLDYTDYKGGE